MIALVDRADISRPPPWGTRTISLQHSLRGSLRLPRGIAGGLEDADIAVLHGGWTLGNVAVGVWCARAGIPFIVTTHGVYLPEVLARRALVKSVWASVLERPHLRRALAVHVFFTEEASSLRRFNVRMPTIVAPNGISLPAGQTWDGGSGGYLLWLGRFDPVHKGLDLLLRAMALIPLAERPVVRLHGPDWRKQKQRVLALVDELGLRQRVLVGKPVYGDEKWRLMSAAAGCVYPSRWDACPVAVSEAAALGIPTLVTRYPLANFLASRGGAIQAEAEPSSIAVGIEQLLTDDAREVGRTGAEVARRELSWDAVANSWLYQVRALLDQR